MDELLDINNQLLTINNDLELQQTNFLETTFGKIINKAVDIGIKSFLPDLIEDEVINVKDAILTNGFNDGIKQVIDSAIETGKSAIGIVTGNFENISQIERAVKKGGLLDSTSKLLDFAINTAQNKNLIDKNVSSLIKNGKNTVINSISDNIEKTMTNQIKTVEKIEKYCEKWNNAYSIQNLNEMEKAYKNIELNLQKIVPLENIINKARTIENLHGIIKSTGDFELTEDMVRLAQRLN